MVLPSKVLRGIILTCRSGVYKVAALSRVPRNTRIVSTSNNCITPNLISVRVRNCLNRSASSNGTSNVCGVTGNIVGGNMASFYPAAVAISVSRVGATLGIIHSLGRGDGT